MREVKYNFKFTSNIRPKLTRSSTGSTRMLVIASEVSEFGHAYSVRASIDRVRFVHSKSHELATIEGKA